jgi:hypothetical protein
MLVILLLITEKALFTVNIENNNLIINTACPDGASKEYAMQKLTALITFICQFIKPEALSGELL